MDPDVNLQQQRITAAALMSILDGVASIESMPQGEMVAAIYLASELAELARSLDEWIARGGFLPARWARAAQEVLS